MESIRKKKSTLREEILNKRDSLDIAETKSKSTAIKEILFNLKEFKDANNIMLFVSFRSEVMTDIIIKEALALGKNVTIPLVEKSTVNLKLFYINDFNADLSFGAYGILEPKTDHCKRAKKNDLDIVIIPGAAFSKKGDRIGYGVGYYDRFLESLPDNVTKIALAFELQIVDDVPTGEKDVKVDMIITEGQCIRCNE
jgi:5-formyltetrahydrofolate cyclo-ligase